MKKNFDKQNYLYHKVPFLMACYYLYRITIKSLLKSSAMAFAAVVSIWSIFFPLNIGTNYDFYSIPQMTTLWVLIGFAVGLTHAKSEK